ncbi:phospholipid carrier-dependent glycosyltransferase [Streptomyces carminius]|uniref:Polyprenol-phosphate-mannose--protein mannosyltransferase n=1 Tax=Streptomyces carminius TaxID=2665496 RepID=A0A2M8LYL6_9ACTN|nr:phospholipid carrier-dependent glycosyltransferase [Streptomyces carminius]PJE97051.1 phospholipid carrier-dependent glycosyltransferase [Streptomyces carminius]PJE97760.1 phospholipid carrier-dependent glycosyltransferase [Streptomyces carminius]
MARVSSDTATQTRHGEPAREQPPAWRERLRRYGYAPPARAGVRDRLVPPYPEPGRSPVWGLFGLDGRDARRLGRLAGWGGPLLVALFAGLLRFWNLGSPHEVMFDETYYAKDAWALYRLGYEGTWADSANDTILDNPAAAPLGETASYVVHPPAGKWVIALGEMMFGLNPFGWRFMVAVLGTLSVLMVCRIGRRLFRSTALGCLAGVLLAVDGLHLVMSRAALLDLVLMFFVLAAFGCLLIDRDAARARLAAALPPDGRPDAGVGGRLNLGWRPWRLAAGVCLGLACATKWSGAYVLVAFGLLVVLWDVGSRRTAGARRPYRSVLRRDAGPAFLALVPVAVAVYVASWAGWLAGRDGYFRTWAEGREGLSPELGPLPRFDMTWVPEWLRSLWHYEAEVYRFHVNLTSEHPYQSHPWSWLVNARPVSYFYESAERGESGCTAEGGCAREVLALGTPLLWWAACFALLYCLYRWALRRDWRAGAILCGVAAGYLPWFLYQERTIFYFYAVVFVPFLCLALTMMIGAMLGPPGSTERRRAVGAAGAGVLVLAIVWNFVYFYPVYTGQQLPKDAWQGRMWLDTWV